MSEDGRTNHSRHLPMLFHDVLPHLVNSTDPTASADVYQDFYDRAQFVTGLFCYPVVCLFGLTGNVLSIIVLKGQKMRTSTKTYLIAMAISDGIKLINDSFYFVVILMLNIHRRTGELWFGYMYPYAHYFFNMSVCTTAWLTVSVAAERYILVCYATKARDYCSTLRARVTTFTVFWTMSLLTVPLGVRYKTVHEFDNQTNSSKVGIVVTDLWMNSNFVSAYTWIQNLLRSVIPLLILCTLNYFIVHSLRKTRTLRKTISSRHRITLTLISIIVVFMLCVTPDAIMSTFFGFGYYDANFFVRAVREVTDLLLTINSAVNFVIYCTFNKAFRKTVTNMFYRKCCCCGDADSIQRHAFEMTSRDATVRNTTVKSKTDSAVDRSVRTLQRSQSGSRNGMTPTNASLSDHRPDGSPRPENSTALLHTDTTKLEEDESGGNWLQHGYDEIRLKTTSVGNWLQFDVRRKLTAIWRPSEIDCNSRRPSELDCNSTIIDCNSTYFWIGWHSVIQI